MPRRSNRVLAILRAGFLNRFQIWSQDNVAGLMLFNRVRSRYPGLSPHETSTLYQTGISAVRAGRTLTQGGRLLIGNVPTIPGLPSPFGSNRRFVYEVTTEFRVTGIAGMVGPLYRKQVFESDSILTLEEIQRRSQRLLFEQFERKRHYKLSDRSQLSITSGVVHTVAARY